VTSRTAIVLASVGWALLAGCGGLDAPDLNTGQVSGRLTGAFRSGAAFAYALGAPQTKAAIATDGSYTLNGVPVGAARIVLFDGIDRADAVSVEVKPATRSRADDRDAAALAPARTIVAAVRCGGASGARATYAVDGAALSSDARGYVAQLFPLAPGTYTVRASLPGFHGQAVHVDLTDSELAQVELAMDIDEGDSHRGCLSSGCSGGLTCSGDDGQCYACASDPDCGPNAKCDDHVCVADGTERPVCASCTSSAMCSAGPAGAASQPGMCIQAQSGGGNVCSHACALDTDCPSGFGCVATNAGMACVAGGGCAALLQEFGTACFKPEDCHLADPQCLGAAAGPGYCSSRCEADADCPGALGFHCDATSRACVR
jgi:hypothetical protein